MERKTKPPANHIERAIRNAVDVVERTVDESDREAGEQFLHALERLRHVFANDGPKSLTTRRYFAEALRRIADASDEAAMDPDQERRTTLELAAIRRDLTQ